MKTEIGSKSRTSKNRLRVIAPLLIIGLAVALAAKAGSFLIVDDPRPTDTIIVLAGETEHRPQRALDLLAQGYARHIILDVPNHAVLYKFTQLELAQKYIQELPRPDAMSICPIDGLSTKEESKDAAKCLQHEGAHSVLIVTSDFHTRRALDVFRRELPEYSYSVAAARSEEAFGGKWWTHRQWAKIFVDEWLRLGFWWKMIDQWR